MPLTVYPQKVTKEELAGVEALLDGQRKELKKNTLQKEIDRLSKAYALPNRNPNDPNGDYGLNEAGNFTAWPPPEPGPQELPIPRDGESFWAGLVVSNLPDVPEVPPTEPPPTEPPPEEVPPETPPDAP